MKKIKQFELNTSCHVSLCFSNLPHWQICHSSPTSLISLTLHIRYSLSYTSSFTFSSNVSHISGPSTSAQHPSSCDSSHLVWCLSLCVQQGRSPTAIPGYVSCQTPPPYYGTGDAADVVTTKLSFILSPSLLASVLIASAAGVFVSFPRLVCHLAHTPEIITT